mgnify:FL=1
MKANYSEERRMLIGNLNKNKQFSRRFAPTIERMIRSEARALNRNKVEFNKEARRKLDNMRKASGAERPIILYNIENNTVFGEYSSITDAALSLNCNQKTIYRALKTEKKVLLKRWIVNYK